jgi:hypothetical protein
VVRIDKTISAPSWANLRHAPMQYAWPRQTTKAVVTGWRENPGECRKIPVVGTPDPVDQQGSESTDCTRHNGRSFAVSQRCFGRCQKLFDGKSTVHHAEYDSLGRGERCDRLSISATLNVRATASNENLVRT